MSSSDVPVGPYTPIGTGLRNTCTHTDMWRAHAANVQVVSCVRTISVRRVRKLRITHVWATSSANDRREVVWGVECEMHRRTVHPELYS